MLPDTYRFILSPPNQVDGIKSYKPELPIPFGYEEYIDQAIFKILQPSLNALIDLWPKHRAGTTGIATK
jgi:hypothetical protein